MSGQLGILNVGAGDTKLTFDPEKPAECERAAAVVMDMLKRGYAIMVQVGERGGKPLYMRADGFDPATCEYLIVGLPEEPAIDPAGMPVSEPVPTEEPEPLVSQAAIETRRRGRIANRTRQRIVAGSTHGVAIAPISGG